MNTAGCVLPKQTNKQTLLLTFLIFSDFSPSTLDLLYIICLGFFSFACLFGGHSQWCSGVFLVLCSVIIPDSAQVNHICANPEQDEHLYPYTSITSAPVLWFFMVLYFMLFVLQGLPAWSYLLCFHCCFTFLVLPVVAST